MTVCRAVIRLWSLAVLVLICPSAAHAHAPIEGLGTFYAYFLHPLFVPETALLVVGSALLFGQQGRRAARAGLGGVIAGLMAGLTVIHAWPDTPSDLRFALISAALAGVLLSLGRSLPVEVPALLGLACGAVVTLDPDLAALDGRDAWLSKAGIAAGLLFFTVIVSGFSMELRHPVLVIGRQIVGAWIVAAASLVLALSLKNAT